MESTDSTSHGSGTDFKGRWWCQPGGVRIAVDSLRASAVSVLEQLGCESSDAQFVVEAMLEKDLLTDHLRGISGLATLVSEIQSGQYDMQTPVEILAESDGTALVSSPSGIPRIVCRRGMQLCIDKARKTGIAAVGVRSRGLSLAPYVRMAIADGMIGFATTHSIPVMAPTGGCEPILGNSPIAFGFPVPEGPPLVIDMSISQSSATPVFFAARGGRSIPSGVALDPTGRPTQDPRDFVTEGWLEGGAKVAKGSLLPMGEYKGYALSLAFGFLSSILIGCSPSWNLRNDLGAERGQPGTFFIAINIESFGNLMGFGGQIEGFLSRVRDCRRVEGVERIYYPGERSGQTIEQQLTRGWVELPGEVVRTLEDLFGAFHLQLSAYPEPGSSASHGGGTRTAG